MNPDLINEFLNNPTGFMDKMTLGEKSQVYIDNLVKQLQILWYAKELEDERINDLVYKKIVPMFELLAQEMGKMVEEYQAKNGEI